MLLTQKHQLANQRTPAWDLLLAGLHASRLLVFSPLNQVRGRAFAEWSMSCASTGKHLDHREAIEARPACEIALLCSAETPGYTDELFSSLYHVGRFTERLTWAPNKAMLACSFGTVAAGSTTHATPLSKS